MESLFEALGSNDPGIRSQAVSKVQALPPDQIVELVQIAQPREKRTRNRILSGFTVSTIALLWIIADCTAIFQISVLLTVAAFIAVYNGRYMKGSGELQ